MELEHLNIKKRLTDEKFASVYYESMKRKLKIKPIYECQYDDRLQSKRFFVYYEFIVVYYESMNRKLI